MIRACSEAFPYVWTVTTALLAFTVDVLGQGTRQTAYLS
jgi:hypothetical protein